MDHQDCGGKKYKQICTCGGGWCAVHCSENRVRSWFVGENCHHIWSPPPVQETGQIKKPKMIHNKYWSNILPHFRTSGKGLSTGKDDAPTLNDLEEDDDGKKTHYSLRGPGFCDWAYIQVDKNGWSSWSVEAAQFTRTWIFFMLISLMDGGDGWGLGGCCVMWLI